MSQDSFAILEKISESSTTTVYKAHQNVLDRTVLLKILHKFLLRDKNLLSRFTREAKACAILQCENIVQVYDLTEVDEAPAIVMEYVQGKSLEEVLLNGGHSEDLMMKVAVSVLKALSYAHARGVIHRDIKPGNILVSESGLIKVTDFGLAAVSDAPSLTMEGSLIGTPAYMSPEQARGEIVDSRTDLFSLGITLIETVVGEQILLGSSYAECLNRIQSFRLQSIERFSENFSAPMFEFLKGLLASDKDGRFSSADEALNFLNSIIGEKKGLKRIKKFVVNNRKSKLFLAGFVMILVFALVLGYIAINSTKGSLTMGSLGAVDTLSHLATSVKASEKKTNEIIDASDLSKKITPSNETSLNQQMPLSRRNITNDSSAMASPDSGFISITCSPWADVNIDSEYIGKTPLSGSIKFPVGKHFVTFTNPFFAPIVKEVELNPKTLSTIDADFLKDAGYIFVTVLPWGNVYVDDLRRDQTPLSKPIPVSSGVRKLRIQNPAFKDIIQNIKVLPGDTLRLNFNFQAKN